MKYNNLFDLQDKIVVITGGAGLIGKELVRRFAQAGAITVLADINRDKSRTAKKKFMRLGLEVIYRYLDITKEKSVCNLINSVDKRFGRIDIWINSTYPKTLDWQVKFEHIKFASWKKNIDMHLNGYFICCQKIAEYMKKRQSGSIINFASIYGIVGPDFSIYKNTKMTLSGPYSAAKGGIVSFTRYLASYYGKYNIRVNCVSPGGLWDKQPNIFVKRYTEKTPLKRMADKEDIAGAVIFLASDAASYVTGHNLVVDGGWSII